MLVWICTPASPFGGSVAATWKPGHGFRHRGVLGGQHAAERAREGADDVLRQLRAEGRVICGDDLLVNVALVPHVVHPNQGFLVFVLDGAVVHLAAVGGVGVEIVQYAPGRAEIAQTLNFIGAEGDLTFFRCRSGRWS